jgi:hypothetical protein
VIIPILLVAFLSATPKHTHFTSSCIGYFEYLLLYVDASLPRSCKYCEDGNDITLLSFRGFISEFFFIASLKRRGSSFVAYSFLDVATRVSGMQWRPLALTFLVLGPEVLCVRRKGNLRVRVDGR